MGHDVEVIDYRPQSIEKYRMFFRRKDWCRAKGSINKLKYITSCISLIRSKRVVNQKFDSFTQKYLKFSKVVKAGEDVPQYYDVILFGSDQIWNPGICEGLDDIYFGQFPKGRMRFITYAVSIGRENLIMGERLLSFQQNIKIFDKISVRESQVQEFLYNKCNTESEVVCDPSLLLPKTHYSAMASQPIEKNYVLVFNLVSGEEVLGFSKHVAKQIGAKIIEIRAVSNPLRYRSWVRANISPTDFIGYIINARCVVTDSFHATLFSIMMHKDFYTLLRDNNNNRTETLLTYTGLLNRMVDKKERLLHTPVPYNGVDEKIEELRKKSFSFLNRNLG